MNMHPNLLTAPDGIRKLFLLSSLFLTVLGGGVSTVGALFASTSFAQTQQEWQIMQRRLEILENEVNVLRAKTAINADQTNEITGTDALLRLARLEELLRENSGVLESSSFHLQQLQQNSSVFQNDVQLRFQILEDQFGALDATDSESGAAIETVVSDALLRLAQLEELLRENAGTLEDLFLHTQQLQKNATASAESFELRFRAFEEKLDTLETAVQDLGVSTMPPTSEISSASTDSQENPGFTPGPADASFSELTNNSATGFVDILSEETTDESAEEVKTSLLESNPFPDFGVNRNPASEESPESVFESTLDLVAAEELAAESVVETNPELEPKPLGVLTMKLPAETQNNVVFDNRSDDPATILADSYALLESNEFGNDTFLQEEAIRGFRNFIAAYPDHEKAPEAHYQIGEIFYARDDYRAAAEAFVKASQTDRDSPIYLLKLGETLRQLGQVEKACETFDELLYSGRFANLSNSARRLAEWERQRADC